MLTHAETPRLRRICRFWGASVLWRDLLQILSACQCRGILSVRVYSAESHNGQDQGSQPFCVFFLWLLEKTMPTSMFSLVYNPLWPGGMLPRMTRGWAALVYPFVMFFSPLSLPVQLLMNEERLGYFLSLSPSRSKLQLKDTAVSAGRYCLRTELISATLGRCLIVLIRGDILCNGAQCMIWCCITNNTKEQGRNCDWSLQLGI